MNFSSASLFFLYRSEQPRVEGGERQRKKCNFLLSKRFGVSRRTLAARNSLSRASCVASSVCSNWSERIREQERCRETGCPCSLLLSQRFEFVDSAHWGRVRISPSSPSSPNSLVHFFRANERAVPSVSLLFLSIDYLRRGLE